MATVRSFVRIPLNGISTPTWFYTFDGLSRPDHFAIRFGSPPEEPLVRVHSECVTGDVFGSLKCDCGSQLRHAIEKLDGVSGWLIYLRQEGRGIGLAAKLDAYLLQEQGLDTFAANRQLGFDEDARDYADAAAMLRALNSASIHLLTGNPEKAAGLGRAGVLVRATVPCNGVETMHNQRYMAAKRARNGLLHSVGERIDVAR